MKIEGRAIGKFLFHGTREPIGTPAGNIRPPSLTQPFFVTDSMDVLMEYVGIFPVESLWVMTCDPDELAKNSWYINDPECLNKLKSKLPKTTEFLEEQIKKAKKDWRTLFDVMNKFLTKCHIVFYEDIDDEIFKNRILDVLKELDLLEMKDGVPKPVKTIIDAFEDGAVAWMEARRLVKSKILAAIKDLGYKALIDNETTGQKIGGYEFGLLDKSLIKNAWSVSVHPRKSVIDEVIQKMKKTDND